ncbi:MAG TPA: hypothetical protein DCR58_03845 [Idiomarina baltica]|uniref:diguanylate cyclase n=1 Tax=Idiomarina baltica TaxID=190892 RepID=A0A348WMZ0_9GAMM|nr:hypothetical protein [Idiomarina baltica]
MTRWSSIVLFLVVIAATVLWFVFSSLTMDQRRSSEALNIEYFSTPESLSIEAVKARSDENWHVLNGSRGSFGYTDDHYWLTFNISDVDYDRVLYMAYPLLDSIHIHWFSNDGLIEYNLGDKQPFFQRAILISDFAIPVPANQTGEVFIEVVTSSSMRVPVSLMSEADFFDAKLQRRLVEGLYFGVLFCMTVYNLFGFIASREPEFGIYSLYTIFFGGLMLSLDGLGFRYLWPNWLYLQDKGIPIFGSLTLLTAALFAYQLLRLKNYRRTLARGLFIMAGLALVSLAVGAFSSYKVGIHALLALAVPGCLYLLIIGVYLWKKGLIYARMFTIAWGALLLSVMVNSLGYLGIIDSMFIQRHAIMLGSGLEILLLSWVLAVRYNEQRRERLIAQQRYNEELETRVEERTFELEITLRELQEANNELEQRNLEDPLTGLHNRRYFTQQIEREYRRSRRNQKPMCLLMIDIDKFKAVNDTYGHGVGDDILQAVSTELRKQARRPTDAVCRYGGEEFAFILAETDLQNGLVFAERLVKHIRQCVFSTRDGEHSITISAGVAAIDNTRDHSVHDLFTAADSALYKAKREGRDQVVTTSIEE